MDSPEARDVSKAKASPRDRVDSLPLLTFWWNIETTASTGSRSITISRAAG